MHIKKLLMIEAKKTIEQERMDRVVNSTLKDMIKLQKQAETKVWVAKIYTKFGGPSLQVFSFAKNYSEAEKEIKSLPHFKSFSQRPKKEKLKI